MISSEISLEQITDQMQQVRDEIGKIIVGQDDVVEGVLIGARRWWSRAA